MAYLSYKMLAEYVILEKLKDEIEITDADKNAVAQFVQAHYLHKFPTGIKKIFAVNHKQQDGSLKMIGMAMYGSPFMTVSKFLEPAGIKLQETLELKRLFIDDVGIRNIESFVIGQTLGKIRKEMPEIRVVFTFADDKAGHVGAIYQATNAIYLGKSDDGKHKYIYIMNDDDKKNIEQIIKPQAYPKKEVPTTEAIKPRSNQAQYDMLAQIKKELQAKGDLPPDLDPPDREAEREAERERDRLKKPYAGYQGAHRRKFDKQSKLINAPPLAETSKLSDLTYKQKQDLLAAIKAELEKGGKLQPAEVPEPPIDYPRPEPSSHRYQDPLKPNKTPVILPNDDIDPDDDEAALNQKVIDAMKTMPYADFEKDLFHPQGDDPEVPNMRLGKMTKYNIKKKPRKSKSSLP